MDTALDKPWSAMSMLTSIGKLRIESSVARRVLWRLGLCEPPTPTPDQALVQSLEAWITRSQG